MAYPGDPFIKKSIPTDYVKQHPALSNLINGQRQISKYGDILHIVNNKVIPKDFYNKAIEINTDRSKTHFQGILRHPSSNVLYLSGSDKRSHVSQLFVMKASKYLKSAPNKWHDKLKIGPMGSNVVEGKPDAAEDSLLSIFQFSNDYWHGGGMDTEGEILVIPLENAEKNKSKISFLCINDPLKPIHFEGADIVRKGEIAGAAGLIRLKDGKYLCGVWIDSDDLKHRLDLYVSVSDDLADGFKHGNKYIKHSINWEDEQEWVGVRKQRNFQNFQFLRDVNGDIFCYATDNKFKTTPALPGLNRIHLLKLKIDEDALSGSKPKFVKPMIMQINEMKINNVRMKYNFNAGGSFYITPEGRLALYSVAHWRNSQDCISMAEFYPPLEDTNQTITDLALARIELYDDENYGINRRGFMMQRCLKIIGGNNNQLIDFEKIKVHGEKFDNKVNSVKLILPKNYSLWLFEKDHFGGKKHEIKGKGKYEEIKNLKKVSKIGGKVSSMKIVKNK